MQQASFFSLWILVLDLFLLCSNNLVCVDVPQIRNSSCGNFLTSLLVAMSLRKE